LQEKAPKPSRLPHSTKAFPHAWRKSGLRPFFENAARCMNVCYSKVAENTLVWMNEVAANGNREASHFKRLFHWIKLKFTRHEIWALKIARRVPFLVMLPVCTLSLWFVLPTLPIVIMSVVLLESGGIFGQVFIPVVAAGGLAIYVPWHFRWYFIGAGLMSGRTKMAQSKENELSDRLERLEGTNSTSERI
jgi:hypothetical protein